MDHEPIGEYKLKLKDLNFETPNEFKKINCPSCKNDVPASNLNINDKIAKCDSCDIVFPFHQKIVDLLQPKKIKQEVIRPEGIEIFEYRDGMEFTINQPVTVFDVIPLLLLFFSTLILILAFFKEGISWIWPATSLGLLIFPIYNLYNRYQHKIYITLDDELLHIKWRPKKMIKDRQFKVSEIDQVYVKSSPHSYHTIYMIVSSKEGQKHINLIGEIRSLSKARYLEQEIERHLGIIDREVPEEKL